MHNEKYTPPQIAKMQIGKSLPHQFNIRAHIYLATAYTPQLHFTYIQHSALEFYFYSCVTCLCLLADLPFIFRLLGNFFPTSLQYFFFRYSSRFSVTSSEMLCSYPLLAFCVHITQFRGKWKIKRTE